MNFQSGEKGRFENPQLKYQIFFPARRHWLVFTTLLCGGSSEMAIAVLLDVFDNVQIRFSKPSRITVNMSCMSRDEVGLPEYSFLAACSTVCTSMC